MSDQCRSHGEKGQQGVSGCCHLLKVEQSAEATSLWHAHQRELLRDLLELSPLELTAAILVDFVEHLLELRL